MSTAVFDYAAFQGLVERFAVDLPEVLACHWTTADLAPCVERLLTVAEMPLTIAVVGQMRAGKSSLLNALVGADLAVTGVNETTATINWFKRGTKEQASCFRVIWKDRPAEDFPLAEIRHWTGDSERAKATRCIEFFADAEFLRQANVVDTPGTRSVLTGHTQALHEFLAHKQDRATRREGESADAIVYVLMPVARQSDADLLADFEGTTRMPGASPYNSLAVVHKWETLTSDDAYAEVQRKCERITRTLGGLVTLVLPVSAPLAVAAERFDASYWTRLLNLTANTSSDLLDDLLLSDKEFKTAAAPSCSLEAAARRQLLHDGRLPWPSFKVIVRIAQRERPGSAEAMRNAVHHVSGIAQLREALRERFLARSRIIKAFSVLSKAWEPCQVAAGRLRNHKNRLARLLEGAERSSGALAAAIAAGAGQLEPVRHYVEETRQTVERDLRSVGEALHRLGEIVVPIKDAYDDMESDLRMLELLDQVRDAVSGEWADSLRAFFGGGSPAAADRVAPLRPAGGPAAAADDVGRAISAARRMQMRSTGDVRRLFEHAVLRLEQIADFIEHCDPRTQLDRTLGE